MQQERVEEILEIMLRKGEEGNVPLEDLLGMGSEINILEEEVYELCKDGFATLKGESVFLTEKGKKLANKIIRNHRLAERLFHDVLKLPLETTESSACTFEHVLTDEVADSICTFLGHPKKCPHGKSIPPGECCKRAETTIESVVKPLSTLGVGDEGKIVYVATEKHERLDRLSSFGVFPGVKVKVHQTRPAFVIQIEETSLAIDREILRDIYVRSI